MTEKNKSDHLEKLLQLQQNFKNQLASKINAIESAWNEINTQQNSDFSDFHILVHSLVGAAGTFGAALLSSEARQLENKIKLLLNNETILNSNISSKIDRLISDIHRISDEWQPSSIPYIPEKKEENINNIHKWQSNVYLVEDDVEIANELIHFLDKSGYKVFYYRNIVEFKNEYSTNARASAIIMDMSFNEGIVAGADTIKILSEKEEYFPPVIFVTVHNDIQARLAAAQAGASRYLTKPLDKNKLLNSLDKLTNRTLDEEYRILIIDDEPDVLDYYCSHLKNAGMNVLSFTDPIKGYNAIEKFDPELIVLDLYMPECSGFDLARVIRQNDEKALIPIVFLSAELDVATQLSAMNLGGDDFLIKPVDAEYFIQGIDARVQRARSINYLNTRIKDALRESEYRLIALDQHAIISMTDPKGNIIFVNNHFVEISGYQENELLGKNHRILKSEKHDNEFYNDLWKTIMKGGIWSGYICNKAKNGEEYWVDATIVPFMDEHGKPYKFVSVRTDITQVKKSEEQLVIAKEVADKANKAKSDFLSSMSHELRTPMNAISGFAQLLLADTANELNGPQISNVEEIMKASKHLLSLINGILNLSKVESGSVDLHIESINYPDILIECFSLLGSLIEERNINKFVKINEEDVVENELNSIQLLINADRMRFKQIVLNLLSNAVKYNIEKGSVTISCSVTAETIHISVSDTGKGISDEGKKDLFKSFNRLGEEGGSIEGSGIGLVITKKLVNLMGGTVGVESKLNEGSTFWFELPIKGL